MKLNMGNADRGLRVVIGLAAIGAGWYYGSWWGALGLIPLATAAVGFCPLYRLVGLSTCPDR
jgi:hypothetical protein